MITILLILISVFAIFLAITLVSFDQYDSCWSQDIWNVKIVHNLGGIIGAKLADIMLLFFGILAYIIPFVILVIEYIIIYWIRYFNNSNYFDLWIRIMGVLTLIASSCGLVTFYIKNIWHYPSGGIIGYFLSNLEIFKYNKKLNILFLVITWISSIVLCFSKLF